WIPHPPPGSGCGHPAHHRPAAGAGHHRGSAPPDGEGSRDSPVGRIRREAPGGAEVDLGSDLRFTVAHFVAFAKAHPTQATIGTTFAGAPVFMAAALFKTMTGLQAPLAQHSSDAAGIADLLAGKVQTHFAGAGAVTEDIRSGKLRALGVTTLTRFELLPDVPPIADAVPGYEASSWVGIVAPRGAPARIRETLDPEINAGLIEAKVKVRMREIGHVPMPMGAVEFGKFIAEETEKWGKVIRAANIKAE